MIFLRPGLSSFMHILRLCHTTVSSFINIGSSVNQTNYMEMRANGQGGSYIPHLNFA